MSRYPLQRVEIYKNRAEAIKGFKEAEASMTYPGVVFIPSQLLVDTFHISMRFIGRENLESIRGLLLDKVVFHFQPSPEELDMIKMMINPRTTVQKPISIIDNE